MGCLEVMRCVAGRDGMDEVNNIDENALKLLSCVVSEWSTGCKLGIGRYLLALGDRAAFLYAHIST